MSVAQRMRVTFVFVVDEWACSVQGYSAAGEPETHTGRGKTAKEAFDSAVMKLPHTISRDMLLRWNGQFTNRFPVESRTGLF